MNYNRLQQELNWDKNSYTILYNSLQESFNILQERLKQTEDLLNESYKDRDELHILIGRQAKEIRELKGLLLATEGALDEAVDRRETSQYTADEVELIEDGVWKGKGYSHNLLRTLIKITEKGIHSEDEVIALQQGELLELLLQIKDNLQDRNEKTTGRFNHLAHRNGERIKELLRENKDLQWMINRFRQVL